MGDGPTLQLLCKRLKHLLVSLVRLTLKAEMVEAGFSVVLEAVRNLLYGFPIVALAEGMEPSVTLSTDDLHRVVR